MKAQTLEIIVYYFSEHLGLLDLEHCSGHPVANASLDDPVASQFYHDIWFKTADTNAGKKFLKNVLNLLFIEYILHLKKYSRTYSIAIPTIKFVCKHYCLKF